MNPPSHPHPPVLLGQASTPEDFHGQPTSNSFVAIRHNDGATEMIRYDSFVALLFKQETPRHMIDHARGGICEEAGEVSSVLKKYVVYGQPLNRPDLVKELGDLRFFIQAVQNLLDIPEQEILQENANKLCIRYKQLMYNEDDARNRDDESTHFDRT